MADPIVLPADVPPRYGWVDVDEVVASPTDQEVEDGLRQGDTIDTDDDLDNGEDRKGLRSLSSTTALAKARAMKTVLLAHGVPEVSIELVVGRPQSLSDSNWDALLCKTNFGHHTVSSYSASRLTPVLSLVKAGRSDLPGPLCNGYGGWDLCARIICFGYANHPGAGGPFTLHGYTIPRDSARRYAFGWEFEGGISAADWSRVLTNPRTGDRMTFHEFMARCGAGTQDYFNLADDAHLEHKTWAPTRKVDRLNYTRASGIELINRYRGIVAPGNPEEDDMPTAAEVADAVWGRMTKSAVDGSDVSYGNLLRYTHGDVHRVYTDVGTLDEREQARYSRYEDLFALVRQGVDASSDEELDAIAHASALEDTRFLQLVALIKELDDPPPPPVALPKA